MNISSVLIKKESYMTKTAFHNPVLPFSAAIIRLSTTDCFVKNPSQNKRTEHTQNLAYAPFFIKIVSFCFLFDRN